MRSQSDGVDGVWERGTVLQHRLMIYHDALWATGASSATTSLMKSRKTVDFADHIVSLSISSLTGVSMLSIESLSLVCQDTCQPPTRIKRIPIA